MPPSDSIQPLGAPPSACAEKLSKIDPRSGRAECPMVQAKIFALGDLPLGVVNNSLRDAKDGTFQVFRRYL